MRKKLLWALPVGVLASLAVPQLALADIIDSESGVLTDGAAINTLWVMVAAFLVMFMQAGFMLLEIGFSRGKNAGTVVPKILINFSIAALAWWACGFAFAFGPGEIIGDTGFFLQNFGDPATAFPVMGFSDAAVEAKFFFQFVFCAVSLAIVWGTTLERIKFGVYVIYAIVFAALIYPIGAHWVFGGGWLQSNIGMQDFAGSTAVHLIGATGGLAVLLLLGARKGKYGGDGKPRPIPGHNMPMFGLGVLILWLGWFGFNPGSTLGALDGRFAEVALITQLACAAGVIAAAVVSRLTQKTLDIGMVGNGAIAALVAITAPSGYVETWAAPIIGAVAGVLVVLAIPAIDKLIDDPVGALSAHGLAGVWGTLSCGIFTAPRLAEYNVFGVTNSDGEFIGGFLYASGLIGKGANDIGGSFNLEAFEQLGAQALGVAVAFAFVFAASFATFYVIKQVYGLRVTETEEDAGLDISEHGMYGYPETFIPQGEFPGAATSPTAAASAATAVRPAPSES
ncbi:MAG TPA: ammonium transporter [Solirubrobacterales bacterium]|jgi:Amt family ammonium transporter|nr:ammonium transporter [Solirubrobacterales bacterium]